MGYKKDLEIHPSCPLDYAFQRIGGKYKARIIWNIYESKVLRYGELKKIIYGITPKMLTQTLRELEEDHLLMRKVFHEVPPKVEYTITPKAKAIIPFIEHLKNWGAGEFTRTGSLPLTSDSLPLSSGDI